MQLDVTFPLDDVLQMVGNFQQAASGVAVERMIGGASTRQFARVRFGEGGSIIAIFVPDANRSDEVEKGNGVAARWPFLEVRDLLDARGIRVPRVLAEACDRGLLLVEDLGDLTLSNALEQHPEYRTRFYQAAVRDLARAQRQLLQLPPGSVVAQRAFDADLLLWEIQHFREWALENRGIQLTPQESAIFEAAAEFIANRIAVWPRTFVHRDYQSRNLMVRFEADGQFHLTWIDFQDALLGPRIYDMVALLGDSYQHFERAFVLERLSEFARALELESDLQQLEFEFDLVTVQRKLKDAGRFVFIDRVKGNPSFLGFVEPTIDKVLHALTRLRHEPKLAALETLLRTRLRQS
jgi:aminoglycoside/choline kinase family phosphotransferase